MHGVPGGENMGGNIPTYFLVQSKDNISRQNSIREERASNWVEILFHLVTIILAIGSSELPNERNATVDLQLLQVYLQIYLC